MMEASLEAILLKGARVIDPAQALNGVRDVLIEAGKIKKIAEKIDAPGAKTIDLTGKAVAPGLVDLHCHLRDPGLEYKEDIVSGTKAAARGGFTSVCCMANTKPVNDNAAVTRYILEKAREQGSGVHVYPIGALSKGLQGKELAEIGKMKEAGICAISDDGHPVENSNLLRLALEYADYFGIRVLSHSEDIHLVNEGVMNEGYMSTLLGLRGTTRAAEEVMIARDIIVAETLGKPIHLCHVSTRGGVQLIREAKARGVRVTAETAPHYLAATDAWVEGYDTMTRVNPPLRTEDDRLACIAGLMDGTLDCIATDHAPHHRDEKMVEYPLAASGISGFESAFAICHTVLCREAGVPLSKLIEWMSTRPASILSLPAGSLCEGAAADVIVIDPDEEWTIRADEFLSRGHNTPFDGKTYTGRVRMCIADGRIIHEEA